MVRYTLAAGATLAVAATAAAAPRDGSHDHQTGRLRASYAEHREQVVRRFGRRAPGRNILAQGMRDGTPASRDDLRASDGVLRRMLDTPAPATRYAPRPVRNAPVASQGYALPARPTGGGVPAELQRIARCESQGNYHAVNPSSGAYGKYQILPSTSAAYGCDMASERGQDACAVRIYAGGRGRSQWVC